MGILERAGSTLFIGLALVIGLAGCGGPSASPEPSEPADLAIIRSWIAAMNEQDYATAKSLMADEVDTPGGRYAGDQIDAQLRTHCHRASIESFEAVGSRSSSTFGS